VTEAEAREAIIEIENINARKQAMGVPNPHLELSPVPLRKIDLIKTAPPPNPMNDTDLLVAAGKKVIRAQKLLAGDDSDGLRDEMVIMVLKKTVEDINTVVTRLKG
jgi:hypothetical protein